MNHFNLRSQITHNRYNSTAPFLSAMPTLWQQGGIVSEITDDPFTLNTLLPLLQQLAEQPRWQLWLAPQHKLSRSWLADAGLPANKIVQMPKLHIEQTIATIEKALTSGNFSTVLVWLPQIDAASKMRLQLVAEQSKACVFIMLPKSGNAIH